MRSPSGRLNLLLNWLLVAGGLVCLFTGLAGCQASPVKASNGLRLASPQDLLPLVQAVRQPFFEVSGNTIELVESSSRLLDLKAGKVDAVLLGREPTRDELAGLQDHIIAYDAVCIVVNDRTYRGGIKTSSDASLFPLEKYEGIQNISREDVRGFAGRLLGFTNHEWTLKGPSGGKYVYQVNVQVNEDGTRFPIPDLQSPYKYSGMWVWEEVPFVGEVLPAGKFDTQSALLQKLVLPETILEGPNLLFVFSAFDTEELLVSRRFQIQRAGSLLNSPNPIDFFLNILSRRVVVKALEYKFGLRALAVDGIDPIGSPEAVYSGLYPFSRRIHYITRNPYFGPERMLAGYLRLPAAQALIAGEKYLPIFAPSQ